ncbi:hypothetical protein Pcar_3355 [Syntrophotalea carbinolica DSM 2380]|uniref:Uncharacterized protein n=1 Tax=Syntrophotalea carbinolica (strain DSM 2380 / NBRC 103641 / GraBd1) TaxID=338963 RepID=Q0C6G8_SYNC1|nr:hypothetical protein Pcar_3355 [Syntrophotalea carbinolica DSM 2380]
MKFSRLGLSLYPLFYVLDRIIDVTCRVYVMSCENIVLGYGRIRCLIKL